MYKVHIKEAIPTVRFIADYWKGVWTNIWEGRKERAPKPIDDPTDKNDQTNKKGSNG